MTAGRQVAVHDERPTSSDTRLATRLMAYDVRLATRITAPVDRRLRMLALVQRQPLSHVLSVLLDQALPSTDELASLLKEKGSA